MINLAKTIQTRKIFSRMKMILHVLWLILMYPIVVLFPRDKKKILFGAWCGNQFSDNPKYFLKYIIQLNKGYKCYWFGHEGIRKNINAQPGVKFVRMGSLAAKWHLLTATWAVSNLGADCDVTQNFPTYGKIKFLSFWHGAAYKGTDGRYKHALLSTNPLKRFWQYFTVKEYNIAVPLYCYSSFSFDEMRKIMAIDIPFQFKYEMSISAGTARVDYLVNNAHNVAEIERVKKHIGQMLGLPVNKRWYLYMPTWRQGLKLNYSVMSSCKIEKINKILEQQNAILIEKQHPQVLRCNQTCSGWNGFLYVVSSKDAELNIDSQELLLASERLITDYSSCFCDFEVMNRPVIHYAYDYKDYINNERKNAHDLKDVAAGPIAYDEDEFIACLEKTDDELLCLKAIHASSLVEGEKGNACSTFANWVRLI